MRISSRVFERVIVGVILFSHALLLLWSASIHSPTIDEPAHLASGIDHWKGNGFRAYCVNPHLVRMVAALPVMLFYPQYAAEVPVPQRNQMRPEFRMGREFVEAVGGQIFWLITIGRWSCVLFSCLGGLGCYIWAKQLYGSFSAYMAILLWCFLPETLGHGALITPDVPAAAIGVWAGFTFWRFLKAETVKSACIAGTLLGLTLLTKTTWIILFGLWPLVWIFSRWCHQPNSTSTVQGLFRVLIVLFLGWFILNAGYFFQGTFSPLSSFRFQSSTLSETDENGIVIQSGNRFRQSWLRHLPVPLPKAYIVGIDLQKRDFEDWKQTYLGQRSHPDGIWYFYLYAAAVKLPLGFLTLLGIRVLTYRDTNKLADSILVSVPLVLFLVASTSGSLAFFRYLMPAWPLMIIWISGLVATDERNLVSRKVIAIVFVSWSIMSSLLVYPHSLSYFNEAAGGSQKGHVHLIDCHIDWGQDLLLLADHWDGRPEKLNLAYYGPVNPRHAGLQFHLPPESKNPQDFTPPQGWYAISVHFMRGGVGVTHRENGSELYLPDRRFTYFANLQPTTKVGYSIYLYHVE